MSALLERIREEAKKLSADEQFALGVELIEGDRPGDDDPHAIKAAWDEKIRRRVDDVRSGRVKLIPASEVFAELDEKLRCRKINYLIHGERIAIVAIAHDKRRPFYWRDRLAQRDWMND